jgi:hypothetical protein
VQPMQRLEARDAAAGDQDTKSRFGHQVTRTLASARLVIQPAHF